MISSLIDRYHHPSPNPNNHYRHQNEGEDAERGERLPLISKDNNNWEGASRPQRKRGIAGERPQRDTPHDTTLLPGKSIVGNGNVDMVGRARPIFQQRPQSPPSLKMPTTAYGGRQSPTPLPGPGSDRDSVNNFDLGGALPGE